MWFILLVAAVVGPIAYWQYGTSGAIVVSLAAATMLLSMLLADWAARRFAQSDRAAMGLLAGTAIRMILPLAFVLAVVVLGRGRVERHLVLYILPLYFAMLLSDTVKAVRRANATHDASNPALQSRKKPFGS
jgi:hypothetical protein